MVATLSSTSAFVNAEVKLERFLFSGSIDSLKTFCLSSKPVPCPCLQAAELPVRAQRTKAMQQMKGKSSDGQLGVKGRRDSC